MKKAAIFDLDGTLLYTLEDLTDSTNFALAKYDYPVCTLEQIRSYVGNGVYKLIERALPDGAQNPDFFVCLETFKNHYKQNMYNKTRPYDGVIKMLKELKSKNIKTAVVSNKFDAAVKELCRNYFGELIDIAVGESENVQKKPAPDGVLKVVKEFGLSSKECVYTGDSEVDIQTAKNAEMDCISVDWGYKNRDFLISNGALLIVSDIKELTQNILSL